FELKPSLAPQRLQQQSGRTTLGQGTQECMETVGSACPMPPSTEDGAANISHGQCMDEYVSNNPTMLCLGHPLYLYGAEGKEVKVSVHTPVYDDSPEYTNGYHVTLLDSGLMKVNGEIY